MINLSATDLPILSAVDEIKNNLVSQNTLVLQAPPGAGKSTLLPLLLLEEAWLGKKKILMLEPRRVAAKGIAMRMAHLLNEKVGDRVGYRIRFETVVSSKTQLEIVTEGILTRILQSDNALEEYGLIVFDEFHERSLHSDLALALCREAQQIVRPDLRILIMSATINSEQIGNLFSAPVVKSEGRMFPVQTHFCGDIDAMILAESVAKTVIKASLEQQGDILAFLPGEGEIMRCKELLDNSLHDIVVLPLYGSLPIHSQVKALFKDPLGRRKVVLATSIAETSLTIEGVKVVVDSGFTKTLRFNPSTSLSSLQMVEIARDSADQRAGRAGRTSPGVCYRLWSNASHLRKSEHRLPEILEADLTSLVLTLSVWGIKDIGGLSWLNPPPTASLKQAYALLESLNAIEKGKITTHGVEMEKMPCHPRIAHMLLKAQKCNLVPLATDLAAILEERDPLYTSNQVDINLRIEALRKHRRSKSTNKSFERIEKVALQYRQLLKTDVDNGTYSNFDTGLLLAFAFPERIASARPGNNALFQLSGGAIASFSHTDDLAHHQWLAVASMDARESAGKIFLAAPLDPTDLKEFLKETSRVEFDKRTGVLQAVKELRLGNLILQSQPLHQVDKSLIVDLLIEEIERNGVHLLDFNEDVVQWQNRILSLRIWDSELHWPDVTTSTLLRSAKEWLTPYLVSIRKLDDLKRLDLYSILHNSLNYSLQGELDRLAPQKILVPSGSSIKLIYSDDGAEPILAVRLQEVFGMLDTPLVFNNKKTVLMHLLSPGFKLVQITKDLRSFWGNAYFDVRKDLRARYPKHSWPEEPLKAEAIRGAKRRVN